MRFFDLDHKIHQNQNHEITKISKIKIMRSQDFFDLELVDQKIMDHKYDPQFYDLIFDLPTVRLGLTEVKQLVEILTKTKRALRVPS